MAEGPQFRVSPEDSFHVVSLVRRMALQTGVKAATSVLERGLTEMIGAKRVLFLGHDPRTGAPWTPELFQDWLGVNIAPDEAVMAFPVGVEDALLGMLVAVHAANEPVEDPDRDHVILALTAERAAPFLWQLAQNEAMKAREAAGPKNPLFRQQALDRRRDSRREGAVAKLSPHWVNATYWIVLAGIVIFFFYGLVARLNQYSTGPAVVRMEGTIVASGSEGNLMNVFVQPGDRVTEGQPLVQFGTVMQKADLDEIQAEYERTLASFLLDPSDPNARAGLVSLVVRKQKAQKLLDMRTMKASKSGIVSDVRVRQGSHLNPGDQILTIIPEDASPTLVALLPGGDRPRMKAGMVLQLEIPGFERVREKTKIDTIGAEVIGPQEAQKYLGEKTVGSVQMKGPVVLVRCKLPKTFEAKGKTFNYHDGMVTKAEVIVRDRSALLAIVPGMDKL